MKVILLLLVLLLSVKCYAGEVKYLAASWYSEESLKKEGTWKTSKGVMANGKTFDENRYTCATRLYPLGATLLVTNGKRSVRVSVSDRIGKRFAETRIDLSKTAFAKIADLDRGVIPVTVERIK